MEGKVVHYTDVKLEKVTVPGAKNAFVRWLISDKDGAPHFAMRLFEVGADGNTPLHNHPWEHEIFILEGEAKVRIGDKEFQVKPGYVIYIPPNVEHTIVNIGRSTLKFICLKPLIKQNT